ncbi:uncharacterized protein LOC128922552 [Zeugodacus cucurbitae]|uniref:uncharacterized protein LOC128922552 n=1 Tax=Zeugodacus cucurbitae TaxID=28588 RepID=UPI0023D94700|nr:uncharacterized protein LOC128922552 [Zeugodacus cucurbitae]
MHHQFAKVILRPEFGIDGRELPNRGLLTWSTRLVLHFKKIGLRHDDVIAIVAKHSTYTSSVAVGCFMNCTPFHAVNSVLDQDTIHQIFKVTAPKIIFYHGEVYEKIHEATQPLKPLFYTLTKHINGVGRVEDLLDPIPNEEFYKPELLVLGGEQTVAIACSSGTTGMPKCVCIPKMFLENGLYIHEQLLGLVYWVVLNFPLCEYKLQALKKYKISLIFAAPRHVSALITCPAATTDNLSSIRSFMVGGGFIGRSTLKQLKGLLKNEEVINELPEVSDVCVVGVYDEKHGDAAGAVVVLRQGAELTEEQMKNHTRTRLPLDHKQLHAGVIFVDRLPQNANGKTLKRDAQALFENK